LGNLIAYDKQTDTLFLQETGEAMDGPLLGETLKQVDPSQCDTRVRWEDWRKAHPHTLVMVDPKAQ